MSSFGHNKNQEPGLGNGGAAETSQSGGVYPYAKRVYLCTRGNAELVSLCKEGLSMYEGQRRDSLSLCKEGLSIYKRVQIVITVQGD